MKPTFQVGEEITLDGNLYTIKDFDPTTRTYILANQLEHQIEKTEGEIDQILDRAFDKSPVGKRVLPDNGMKRFTPKIQESNPDDEL